MNYLDRVNRYLAKTTRRYFPLPFQNVARLAARAGSSYSALSPGSLLDGLVAYYKFDEHAGTRFDATGQGNDLTPMPFDNIATVTGKIGLAANLQLALTQWLECTAPNFSLTQAHWTIAGWAAIASKTVYNMIVDRRTDPTNGEFQISYRVSSDRWGARVWTAAGFQLLTCTNAGSPALNTWYFFLLRWNSVTQTLTMKINDATTDTLVVGAPLIINPSAPIRFGYNNDGSSYDDGWTDEFRFWKRYLSDAEGTQLYNGGAGLTYPFVTGSTAPTPPPGPGMGRSLLDYSNANLALSGAAEQTIYTYSVVGGTLGTGKGLALRMIMQYQPSLTAQTQTLRVKLAGSTLLTIAYTNTGTALINETFDLHLMQTGALNAQRLSACLALMLGPQTLITYGDGAIDLSATQALLVTRQTTDTSGVCTRRQVILEQIQI